MASRICDIRATLQLLTDLALLWIATVCVSFGFRKKEKIVELFSEKEVIYYSSKAIGAFNTILGIANLDGANNIPGGGGGGGSPDPTSAIAAKRRKEFAFWVFSILSILTFIIVLFFSTLSWIWYCLSLSWGLFFGWCFVCLFAEKHASLVFGFAVGGAAGGSAGMSNFFKSLSDATNTMSIFLSGFWTAGPGLGEILLFYIVIFISTGFVYAVGDNSK